jgi:hypothetical protein
MHPYIHQQVMQARCEDLRRQGARGRGTVARAGRLNRMPLRHDVGWLLVNVGLRLALGPGQHGQAASRTGAAQPG